MPAAVIIGNNTYDNLNDLGSCVTDALAVNELLCAHGDAGKTPNFDTALVTSDTEDVTSARISRALKQLFSSNTDSVLFYFAGHGYLDAASGHGFLVGKDSAEGNPGLTFAQILGMCQNANPVITSKTIILDCCNSGALGADTGGGGVAAIGDGTIILTAARGIEDAQEDGEHGVFTRLLKTGLQGAAADIMGRITPASLYSHIDQSLGPFEQRPVFRANVRDFVQIRQIAPKVSLDILRRLPVYFPDPSGIYELGPWCEPEKDRGRFRDEYSKIELDPEKRLIYKDLQTCSRVGLVVPVDVEHMWDAAMNVNGSPGCRLTELGRHYHRLAIKNRIRTNG